MSTSTLTFRLGRAGAGKLHIAHLGLPYCAPDQNATVRHSALTVTPGEFSIVEASRRLLDGDAPCARCSRLARLTLNP